MWREIGRNKEDKENVAEKKKRGRCCVGYTCGVGQGHQQIFFFFLIKLMKKKIIL